MSSSSRNSRTPARRGRAAGPAPASSWPAWLCSGVNCIVCVACALVVSTGGPVRADGKVVERFLDHYLAGCVRQSGMRGHDRLQSHAWCTCAVAQLRMEGSEAELEALAWRVARGESIADRTIFKRAVRKHRECDALGSHDALPPTRLERARDFGPFSIALPPGFLLFARTTTPDRASYAFHRLHEDLRSAATLQIVVADPAKDRRSGGDADEFRLRGILDELARSRASFRVVDRGETAAGNLRLKRAYWTGTETGEPIAGEAFAGSAGETVVLVRLQDLMRFAPTTLAAMRASVETLRLRRE